MTETAFSPCCFPQTTLCQDYVIAALENCRVWALASLPGFFKVLVNLSHFLQEVSWKNSCLCCTSQISIIIMFIPDHRCCPGDFDGEMVSQDNQHWGHPAAVMDRWCMQRAKASPVNSSPAGLTKAYHHVSNNSQQTSATLFTQLMVSKRKGCRSYSKMFGENEESPSKPPSPIISFNLFSKSTL